jgi:hypothetical protein
MVLNETALKTRSRCSSKMRQIPRLHLNDAARHSPLVLTVLFRIFNCSKLSAIAATAKIHVMLKMGKKLELLQENKLLISSEVIFF